jgi:hypothetical protein
MHLFVVYAMLYNFFNFAYFMCGFCCNGFVSCVLFSEGVSFRLV